MGGVSGETLRAIGELQRMAPPFGADPHERAAWWEEKADAFEQIAADDPLWERLARELAEDARTMADRIRGGGVG